MLTALLFAAAVLSGPLDTYPRQPLDVEHSASR